MTIEGISEDFIRKLFKKELAELLRKYNANIEAKDHYQGYPECGEDIRMEVWLNECVDLDLGAYVDGELDKEPDE